MFGHTPSLSQHDPRRRSVSRIAGRAVTPAGCGPVARDRRDATPDTREAMLGHRGAMLGHRVAVSRRRGTVLIMVVGVLAMMFMVGSTLLVVARFERETAETQAAGRNIEAASSTLVDPIGLQIREDAVGKDGIAYNRAYADSEDSDLEDFADFPGVCVWDDLSDTQKRRRSGDLLTSSLLPYWHSPYPDNLSPAGWYLYAPSWPSDYPASNPFLDPVQSPALVRNAWVQLTNGPAMSFYDRTALPDGVAGVAERDADGDGAGDSTTAYSASQGNVFGGTYQMQLRVVPHGGMVTFHPLTHPSLLTQVLHPEDSFDVAGFNAAGIDVLDQMITSDAEARLRRRFFLPSRLPDLNEDGKRDADDLDKLPDYDLRRMLPITLGYQTPSGMREYNELTPHWWAPNSETGNTASDSATEQEWWEARLSEPRFALTEEADGAGDGLPDTGDELYDADTDFYDRRHLLTTENSDDVLRRQREEDLIWEQTDGVINNVTGNNGELYYTLNPNAAGGTDVHNFNRQPVTAYGYMPELTSPTLVFNNDPSTRTAFSLRDVLDPIAPTVTDFDGTAQSLMLQCSYRRAVQLTSFFLGMLQHTTSPVWDTDGDGTPDNWTKLLRAAAQLAVNTIDFADQDNGTGVNDENLMTCLAWPPEAPIIYVVGTERQPYLTEAYARAVYKPEPPGHSSWLDIVDTTESVYAVELYNPYSESLPLDDYVLQIGATEIDLGSLGTPIVMPPYSYVVLANRYDVYDPVAASYSYLVDSPAVVRFGQGATPNFFAGATGITGSPPMVVTGLDALTIGPGDAVELIRKRVARLDRNQVTILTRGDGSGFQGVVVDRLKAMDVTGISSESHWAERYDSGTTYRTPGNPDFYHDTVAADNDRLVFETSLQRHKDVDPVYNETTGTYAFLPSSWHFTLAVQAVLPPDNYVSAPDGPAALHYPVRRTYDQALQHNLLGARPFVDEAQGFSNQDLVAKLFQNIDVGFPDPYEPFEVTDDPANPIQLRFALETAFPNGTNVDLNLPIAPNPVLVANRGLHPQTGGTLAFPTTGTLLLVSRHGHFTDDPYDPYLGSDDQHPATEIACRGLDKDLTLAQVQDVIDPGQMQQIDNGHLPVFRAVDRSPSAERAKDLDNNKGRLDVPWGQLVFDYFTALPLEELARELPLNTIFGVGVDGTAMIDTNLINDEIYARMYGNDPANGAPFFPFYPLVERATSDAPSPLGPKVRGRINVNVAPWWVLDGLPAVVDSYNTTTPVSPTTSLPVRQLLTSVLDPQAVTYADVPDGATSFYPKIGSLFVNTMFDDDPNRYGDIFPRWPNLSPKAARDIVSYRENRPIYAANTSTVLADRSVGADDRAPGFTTVGQLIDVILDTQLPEISTLGDNGEMVTITDPALRTLRVLRTYAYNRDTEATTAHYVRPFAYLGYLQAVAPIVRLQDWATVKNHVFTVYAGIGDTANPATPIWMRTQVTLDRTRCLYTDDLPDTVVSTPPTGYYNAISDSPGGY